MQLTHNNSGNTVVGYSPLSVLVVDITYIILCSYHFLSTELTYIHVWYTCMSPQVNLRFPEHAQESTCSRVSASPFWPIQSSIEQCLHCNLWTTGLFPEPYRCHQECYNKREYWMLLHVYIMHWMYVESHLIGMPIIAVPHHVCILVWWRLYNTIIKYLEMVVQ